MKPFGILSEVCYGCTERTYPTKENPRTCHATCKKYKDAKAEDEEKKRGIRKRKLANIEADDFTINCIRRTK